MEVSLNPFLTLIVTVTISAIRDVVKKCCWIIALRVNCSFVKDEEILAQYKIPGDNIKVFTKIWVWFDETSKGNESLGIWGGIGKLIGDKVCNILGLIEGFLVRRFNEDMKEGIDDTFTPTGYKLKILGIVELRDIEEGLILDGRFNDDCIGKDVGFTIWWEVLLIVGIIEGILIILIDGE